MTNKEKIAFLKEKSEKVEQGGGLKALEKVDPGNRHLVPYMWGTTGIGYNAAKVREVLGDAAPVDSLRMLFDPEVVSRLARCGVTVLDDEGQGLGAALLYLGKDPNTTNEKDIEAAAEVVAQARPHVRYFHSSRYIDDLADGSVCVSLGHSGDVLRARDRAEEADNGVEVSFSIPKEGALLWMDSMVVPKDAPNPEAAFAFINYIQKPEVIAKATNFVKYPNGNLESQKYVDPAILKDPDAKQIEEITLSYTFYPVDEAKKQS